MNKLNQLASLLLVLLLSAATTPASLAQDQADATESINTGESPQWDSPQPEDDVTRRINIGRAQLQSEEYELAANTFAELVVDIETREGIYDEALITPLVGLGDAAFNVRDFGAATEFYRRAQHLTRVNTGLHNPRQINILVGMADAHAALRDFEAAQQHQAYAYRLARRNFLGDPDALLPHLFRYARWFEQMGNPYLARSHYEFAIEQVEEKYGLESTKLIQPLFALADTYKIERFPGTNEGVTDALGHRVFDHLPEEDQQRFATVNRFSSGEKALLRAAEIVDSQMPDNTRERAAVRIKLGDWTFMHRKWERAFYYYNSAEALLAADPGTQALSVGLFDTATPLFISNITAPQPPPWAKPSFVQDGFIELSFNVTKKGTVRDVNVVSAQPTGLMEIKAKRAIRDARFRPRLEAGQPVESSNVTYRYLFKYYAADIEVPSTQPAPTDEGEQEASNNQALNEQS